MYIYVHMITYVYIHMYMRLYLFCFLCLGRRDYTTSRNVSEVSQLAGSFSGTTPENTSDNYRNRCWKLGFNGDFMVI